jgi:hypothetical protein
MDAANPNGGHQSPVVGTDLWVRATDRRSLSTRRNLYSSAPIAVPTPGCGRSQHPERHGAEVSRQSAGSLSYQRTTSGRDHSVASALSSLASQTERDDPPGVETTDEHHGL